MEPRVDRWDAERYLQFETERTLPCQELVRRIDLTGPSRVVDLGCGTGSSTAVLRNRWPHAHRTGLDSSPEMLRRAREADPSSTWVEADLRTWAPTGSYDLVFSNAALQWLPDHAQLLPRLWSWVAPDGALAFQVPARETPEPGWMRAVSAVRTHAPWDRLTWVDPAVAHVRALAEYYDILAARARRVELWDTRYEHVFPGPETVIDWIQGTGLRPLLQQIATAEGRERFLDELRSELVGQYPRRSDGRVLFPFLRRFVIGYR